MGARRGDGVNGVARRALGVACLVLVPSCGAKTSAIPTLTPTEMVAFEKSAAPADGLYRLEPGDRIALRWLYHPDRDQQETVRPDGRIHAAGTGEITVMGRTTSELEAILVERASATLRDPVVSVSILEYGIRWIYVAGEVRNPGAVRYRKGITPLQALMEAGGLVDTALSDGVVLIRANGPNGTPVSRSLDVEQALAGESSRRFALAPRDVLFVPRTSISEANVWVDQHFTKLFPFFNGASGSVSLGGR